MGILDTINGPADVKRVPAADLPALADEVRTSIITTVSRNGGHLAPSLGAVEIAMALARVFDPPKDKIVWDVGHQAYAWKLLTGRRREFKTLRKHGGLSGFCNPAESPCDPFVSGHAGVAIAAAEGMAVARDRAGTDEHVVAVVGDASISNGISFEALNNCTSLTSRLIIVLNDNEMSISRNVGAFSRYLGRLISGFRYNRVKAAAERAGHSLRLGFLSRFYHLVGRVLKSMLLKNTLFVNFGLRYIGPVDGHDLAAVEEALSVAKECVRPVVVHLVTVKGRGFEPAERNPTAWHGVGPFDIESALARRAEGPKPKSDRAWSEVFGDALCEIAREDPKVCALTAAMKCGTGLKRFASEFPDRFFDVGICEEHLVSFAAGLAASGMKPVVAVYSTFLQRAVDNVAHDVALAGLPVVFAVDRAGVVGADGKTHHGLYDIPMLKCIPGVTILQPKDAPDMAAALRDALAAGGPAVVRYPRGKCPDSEEPLSDPAAKVQLWALGDQISKANLAAELLHVSGISAGVVHARRVKPFDAELLARQRAAGAMVVSLENGAVSGGFGESIGADLKFGWPDAQIPHGTTAELESDFGFTAAMVATTVQAAVEREGRK